MRSVPAIPAHGSRSLERWSDELLKHTPGRTESPSDERCREEEHRAIEPRERQPFMVVAFGMLGYKVLWIGKPGREDERVAEREERERVAEAELSWWQDRIRDGMELRPLTRKPSPHDLQVRQQWDLDDLTRAIMDSYR